MGAGIGGPGAACRAAGFGDTTLDARAGLCAGAIDTDSRGTTGGRASPPESLGMATPASGGPASGGGPGALMRSTALGPSPRPGFWRPGPSIAEGGPGRR
jgi:hypothetical protein